MADGEVAAPAAAAPAAVVEAPAAAVVAAAPAAEPVVAAPAGGETTAAPAGNDTVTGGAGNDSVAASVPESYADFTAPDGVALDATVMGEFKAAAKELNLDQAGAQRVVDLGVKLVQQTKQASADQLTTLKDGWATQAASDPEIGGAKLPAYTAQALRGIAEFGSPELKAMLSGSGLMNHPEIIRVFAKVGRAIGNDTAVTDGGDLRTVRTSGSADADAASKLYPNQK